MKSFILFRNILQYILHFIQICILKGTFKNFLGSKYTPRFETLVEGFTSLKMVSREKDDPPAPPSSKTPTHPYNWDQKVDMGSSDSNDGLEDGKTFQSV